MLGQHPSFKPDPLILFDDYSMQSSCKTTMPSQPLFSSPIYVQTSYLPSTSSLPLSPPPLSPSPSSESLRGPNSPATPITPAQDAIISPFRVAITASDFGGELQHPHPICASSLTPNIQDSSNPDLRFSFEARISKEYEAKIPSPSSPPRSPPQLLKLYSERDRHARPPTAYTRPIDTSVPRSKMQESQSAPPTVTSFAEFRQALAERQEARRQEAVKKDGGMSMPALSFLSQDPFQCPLTKRRPKSAGRQEASEDESSRPVSRKSIAPSIASNRSSKPIKRGFSRVKRLFTGSRRDGEKEVLLSA